MGTADTVSALVTFERRGAGTDAERRAALWLAQQLRTPARRAAVQTFWCRPNWALAHAWHVALGVAGSLVSVASPPPGAALLVIALISLGCDALTGDSLGRRLTPERASQNVVSCPLGERRPVRLIVTANYDAGRMGAVHRAAPRRLVARLRTLAGGGALTPGWLGWLAIALAGLIITAGLRAQGLTGTAVAVAQLVPTAALVVALALLLELAGSEFGPGAGDNASGVALALAVARALDVAPPRRLSVEVVLQGAGDGGMIGLRRFLRGRRREPGAAGTIVLGIAPCAAGLPRWWTSDGPLIALRYSRWLGSVVQRAAGPQTAPGALPCRGRGISPALPGRAAGLAAISIGCTDEDGLVPRSHRPDDRPGTLDQAAIDGLLELALTLVDALDAELGLTPGEAVTAPAAMGPRPAADVLRPHR